VHILFAPSNFSCCRLQPSACLSFCLIFQSVQPLLPAPQPYWRRLGDLAATTRGLSFSPRFLVTLFFFHLRFSHVAVSLLSPFGHVCYLLILSSSVLSLGCQDPYSLATVATYLCGYPRRFGCSEPAQDYYFSITSRSLSITYHIQWVHAQPFQITHLPSIAVLRCRTLMQSWVEVAIFISITCRSHSNFQFDHIRLVGTRAQFAIRFQIARPCATSLLTAFISFLHFPQSIYIGRPQARARA